MAEAKEKKTGQTENPANADQVTVNEQTTDTPVAPVTVDMEALKASMMAEMKAELKAEMEAEAAAKNKSVPMTEKEIAYWDEKVTYHVPWIEGEDEEITVIHNGVIYKVLRGEEVKIPRKILDILLNSEKQKREFSKQKKGLKNQELQA